MADFHTIDPASASPAEVYHLLIGAVVPRPIAFVSTVDNAGRANLSPYSFFNAMGSAPPTLVFSVARRGHDHSTKDTLNNLLVRGEAVVHVVPYALVEQMSLTSADFPAGVSEFEKAGLTPLPAVRVQPPRVAEAPVAFECRVEQIVPLGSRGGSGNMVVCSVLLAHVRADVLDGRGRIDPDRLDAVGRMGGSGYVRTSGTALFEVARPGHPAQAGFDHLPEPVRHSPVLTGNELGRLAAFLPRPDVDAVQVFWRDADNRAEVARIQAATGDLTTACHLVARRYLSAGDVTTAWKALSGPAEGRHPVPGVSAPSP